ncbi:hypothetical protein [Streptomyces sp. WG-D5]
MATATGHTPSCEGVSVFGAGEFLEVFLTRVRVAALLAVPAWWGLAVFFLVEEGWYPGVVLGFVLPPVAAYLGIRGHRDVRPGLTAGALALNLATPLVTVGSAWLMSR